VSRSLGNVTIVCKGAHDIIANAAVTDNMVCDERGSLRRCGGQGDILSGCIATFVGWWWRSCRARAAGAVGGGVGVGEGGDDDVAGLVLAAHAGCTLLRVAARDAFAVSARGTTTPDILQCLPKAFQGTFELSAL
jgi:ATP-dependent NAD(P)H-hydrate dehydratase